MAIRVIVNGAAGKMGQVTVASIEKEADLQLVAQTGHGSNLAETIKKTAAQVVVDFTVPACVFENAQTILSAGARPVIGTTGLKVEQIEILRNHCRAESMGCIIAPNFSLGAILMMKYAQEAAKYFPNVEIIEMHHAQKIDAPSGTAIKTAEGMVQSRGELDKKIPIHSIRLPGLFAHQAVIFGGLGETLTIRHDAIDRSSMMPGVFLACRKVMGLHELVYGMESLL